MIENFVFAECHSPCCECEFRWCVGLHIHCYRLRQRFIALNFTQCFIFPTCFSSLHTPGNHHSICIPYSFPFPDCHIVIVKCHVAISCWYLSSSKIYLALCACFHDPMPDFLLLLNNICLCYAMIYLSIQYWLFISGCDKLNYHK